MTYKKDLRMNDRTEYKPSTEIAVDMNSTDTTQSRTKIDDISSTFNGYMEQSSEISKQFTESVKVMDLDDTRVLLDQAFQSIDAFQKIPEPVTSKAKKWVGGLLPAKLGDKLIESAGSDVSKNIENHSLNDIIDGLFSSLKDRHVKTEGNVKGLYAIKDKLQQCVVAVKDQQTELESYMSSDEISEYEMFRAKNLLVTIQKTSVKMNSKIEMATGIMNIAQTTTSQISSLLPQMQHDLIDTVNFSKALGDLMEYKSAFDETNNMIDTIGANNTDKAQKTMLELIDVIVSDASDMDDFEGMVKKKAEFERIAHEKMETARRKQDESLIKLKKIEENSSNMLLSSGSGRKLDFI